MYEDVAEPIEIISAFEADGSDSAQAASAALLALGWQLSGVNIQRVLEQEEASYLSSILAEGPTSRARIPRGIAQDVLGQMGTDLREGGGVGGDVRKALIEQYVEERRPATAAALFEACLVHDDELVRVAAAASYFEIATEAQFLLEVLAEGSRSDDLLVREIAATSLGRLASEHPALDHPWSALSDEAPASAPLNTSLLVHGTFARRESWWQPGGDFHTYVLEHVRPDLYSEPDRFAWSGGYSAAARALAAEELVTWVRERSGMGLDIFAHSHGGSVTMLATHGGISVGTLVLLSVPVHWRTYAPDFGELGRCVSIRVHCDLVILADRGGQRFRDPSITEHILPLWFKHPATHDPEAWRRYGIDKYV